MTAPTHAVHPIHRSLPAAGDGFDYLAELPMIRPWSWQHATDVALDISLVPARKIVYVENTPMFVNIARADGIPANLHENYKTTRAHLASLGRQTSTKA